MSKLLTGGVAKSNLDASVDKDFGNQPPGSPSGGGGCGPSAPFNGIPQKGTPDDSEKHPKPLKTEIEKHPKPIPEILVTQKPKPVPEVKVTQTPPWWERWWLWFTLRGDPAFSQEHPRTDDHHQTTQTTQVEKSKPNKKNEKSYWVSKGGDGPEMEARALIEDCPAWVWLMDASRGDSVYTERTKNIVIAANRAEGAGPDLIHGYDNTALTFGVIQWTWRTDSNGGELVNALWKLMQQEAAATARDRAHVDQFKALFGDSGFLLTRQKLNDKGQLLPVPKKLAPKKKKTDPDVWVDNPGPIVMYWWDPVAEKYLTAQEFKAQLKIRHSKDKATAASKAQKQLQQELEEAQARSHTAVKLTAKQRAAKLKILINKFENEYWTQILRPFQVAGEDGDFQKFQLLEFKTRLTGVLGQRTFDPAKIDEEKPKKKGQPWKNLGPLISEWVEDDELRAQLLQLSLNRPNNVTNPSHNDKVFDDFGKAVQDLIQEFPKDPNVGNPSAWTPAERAKYEDELSKFLLANELRKGHVTDAQKRWDKTHKYYQDLEEARKKAEQEAKAK